MQGFTSGRARKIPPPNCMAQWRQGAQSSCAKFYGSIAAGSARSLRQTCIVVVVLYPAALLGMKSSSCSFVLLLRPFFRLGSN
jgi:hypothetical protein